MNQTNDADDSARSEPKLHDYLAALKRRRKPLLITFAVGLLTSVLLASLLPARYQSTGTILIEQQELPSDLVRSTVTSYADQRVQVISQRVMTTQNLLSIIRRYELYPREQSREPREKLIERMRDDIEFKMISADVVDPRSGAPRKATIAFSVSYRSPVPDTAAKIANELTTLYLNENLTERNRLAQDAFGFLQTEGDRLNTQIQEIESKLTAFKEKHYNELPELQQVNMQQLDRTEQQLHEAQMRRTSLIQQQVFLQSQFVQMKPESAIFSDTGERIQSPADRLKSLRAKLASVSAIYAPDHPDVVRMKREIAGLEAQVGSHARPVTNDLRRTLEQARGQLADLSKKYSPDHPDVQRLERQVAQLEAELAQTPRPQTQSPADDKGAHVGTQAVTAPAVAAQGPSVGAPAAQGVPAATPASATAVASTGTQGAGAVKPTSATTGAGTGAQDAVAQNAKVAEGADAPDGQAAAGADNPAYLQIAAQLDAIRNELRAEEEQEQRLKAQAADYQHKLSLSPEVERDYRSLTRESESAQLKYREIRAKQMEAQVAQNLESDRKGERFTLIEPPLPPEDPVSPNRPLILIVGLLASIALAVGIVAAMEATDGTVRGRKDMLEAFGVPMLAIVPRIITATDIALARRRVKYAVSATVAAGLGTIAAVHFLYRPLDVLWFAAMRHLGI